MEAKQILRVEFIIDDWSIVDYGNIRGSSAPTIVESGFETEADARSRMADLKGEEYRS